MLESDFFFFILNNMPWIWLFLLIILAVIESFTLALTTIWFAAGAFVMVFLSFLHIPLPVQIVLFALISCVLLIFTRPLALKKLNIKRLAANADSLIGASVLVQDAVTELKKGSAKINGIVWNAESEDGQAIESGTKCTITAIKGNTLVLRRSL